MELPVTYYELVSPEDLRTRTDSIETKELGATQIAARTLFTAISPGTELAAFVGLPPLRPGPTYPRLLGYCNVAEVFDIGPSVEGLVAGSRIATHQSHRSAFVCDQSSVLAIIPEEVDPRHASVTYLFHLGYDALLRSDCRAGHTVGVIGLGALGLSAIAVAKHAGSEVFGFSDYSGSSVGKAFGARAVLPKGVSSARQGIDQLLQDAGLDIIVTTSNSWSDWQLALELVRPGGTITVIGFPGRGEDATLFNPLASQYLYDKQLKILGCGLTPDIDCPRSVYRFTLKRNFHFLLGLVACGELPAEKLIGAVRPWSSLEQAYRDLQNRTSGAATYVLDWTG